MNDFTEAQIEMFISYENVRSSGAFNMFSKDAVRMTGLTQDEYTFVMKNYSALVGQYHNPK